MSSVLLDQGSLQDIALSSHDGIICALARGICDYHRQLSEEGGFVYDNPDAEPHTLRQARWRLSRLAIEEIQQDLGADLHQVMEMSCTPMEAWGIPSFATSSLRKIVLIDPDQKVPEEECHSLAALVGEAPENELFDQLMAVVSELDDAEGARAYSGIREFIIRNPVAMRKACQDVASQYSYSAVDFLVRLYKPIPPAALHKGKLRLCSGCGGILWPDKGSPSGVCRIRGCKARMSETAGFREIEDASKWYVASNSALSYWVGPGLDEIEIYDALRAAGRNVTLFPNRDEVDIGIDGDEVGIDVKSWRCPLMLGRELQSRIGRLRFYRRKIVAIPDRRVAEDPEYLGILKEYCRGMELEFMTTSRVIMRLRKP